VIVDTSALVAIVFQEDGYEHHLERIITCDPPAGVPSMALVELGIVLGARLGRDPCPLVARMVEQLGLDVIGFSHSPGSAALSAAVCFGRGRHRAALNLGDCLSSACADLAGEPLLFVGEDFTHTDIDPA
jgi:ribonuclease VapC